MKGFFREGSPIIGLEINENKIDLLLDTGFNGHIMLSQRLIDKIRLEQIGVSDYITASGEETETRIFRAKMNFLGEEIEVPVLSTEGDFSLAGMELFHNCRILIEKSNDILELTKIRVSLD